MNGKILIALRSWVILCLCGFSLFMIFAAPYELYAVAQVQKWEKVPARALYVGWRRGSGEMSRAHFPYLVIEDQQTRKKIEIMDIRPGDLPFSTTVANATVYDSRQAELTAFAHQRDIMAYRSPDGERYYLEAGSPGFMLSIFMLSVGWLVGLIFFARLGRRTLSQPE